MLGFPLSHSCLQLKLKAFAISQSDRRKFSENQWGKMEMNLNHFRANNFQLAVWYLTLTNFKT